VQEQQHPAVTPSLPWTRLADGSTRCHRHAVTWKPNKPSCAACRTDPGPAVEAIEAVALPDPPVGCLSSEQRERWFTELAEVALGDANRLSDLATAKPQDVDFHVESNITKHREVAIKAARAATDLALRREDEHITAARDKAWHERMARRERSH
jgi:hypothetical protein